MTAGGSKHLPSLPFDLFAFLPFLPSHLFSLFLPFRLVAELRVVSFVEP